MKSLHHRQRHVGIQQRQADLAQRLVDIGLVQRAAAAQPVENARELAGKCVEHGAGWPPTKDAPVREPSRTGGTGRGYGRAGIALSSNSRVGARRVCAILPPQQLHRESAGMTDSCP